MYSDYHILHNAVSTITAANSDNVASTRTISLPAFKVRVSLFGRQTFFITAVTHNQLFKIRYQ